MHRLLLIVVTWLLVLSEAGAALTRQGTLMLPELRPTTSERFDSFVQEGELVGLYYLRARYLNAANGRFWNADTYEGSQRDPQSLHKYLYCYANPLNGHDPTGHDVTLRGVAITAAIIAVAVVTYHYAVKPILDRVSVFLNQFRSSALDERTVTEIAEEARRLGTVTGTPKFLELADHLNSGVIHVRVYDDKGMSGGSHFILKSSVAYISQDVSNKSTAEIAMVVFAEYQHDTLGGGLNESQAQEEFETMRNKLPPEDRTPYVNGLRHGFDF